MKDIGTPVELQDLPPLNAWASAPWNEGSAIPIEDWLVQDVDSAERARLKACGNIAIPPQASLAAAALARFLSFQ